MARITLSGLLTDIRGSVGGSTFQNSQAGLILRNKPHQLARNTLKQNSRAVILDRVQQAWNTIGFQNRNAWQVFAKSIRQRQVKNAGKFQSGQSLFMRCNYFRLIYGDSIQDSPSFNTCFFEFVSPLDIEVGAAIVVPFNDDIPNLAVYGVLDLSNSYTTPNDRNFKPVRLFPFDQIDTNNVDITALWETTYGTFPLIGQFVNFRMRLIFKENGVVSFNQTGLLAIVAP